MSDIKIRKISSDYDDVSVINMIRNQSSKYLHDDRTFTIEQTLEWFRNTNPDWYAIEHQGKMIGYFRISNYSEANRNLYIGADIEESMRGLGLGYKSYLMMMERLFKERKLNKITLEVLSNNQRAHGLYSKLGFVEEGRKREEIYREGAWIDSVIMSITRKEFISKHGKITSPCVGICQRQNGKCSACGRSLDQISKWKEYGDEERIDVVKGMIIL